MNDSQILSAFPGTPAGRRPLGAPARLLVFDACQLGVVLRAVLFVEAVMAVGALFGAADWREWAPRLGRAQRRVAAGHPGLAAGGLQPQAAAGPPAGAVQQAFGIGPGRMLAGSGRLRPAGCQRPDGQRALGGVGGRGRAAAVGLLVAALVLRAKGRMPADTAARLSELQARIRPHFLFNTLNSAIALVREDPPGPRRCWRT
jgi:two-component system sensor histidine kinase AlgZ